MEQLPEIIDKSWHEHLRPLFNDLRMKHIKYSVLPKCRFLPEPKNIFRVFAMPIKDVKVVILGQDPYPKPGDANGLAFAVNKDVKTPFSLQTIYKEILVSGEGSKMLDSNGNTHHFADIDKWEEQGVFLLNTALTVEVGNSGRHLRMWRWFTEEIIKIISMNKAPIWLLWGKKAQSFEQLIVDSEMFFVNEILKAPHPAAEAYAEGKAGFYGCNHFRQVNEILRKKQLVQIQF